MTLRVFLSDQEVKDLMFHIMDLEVLNDASWGLFPQRAGTSGAKGHALLEFNLLEDPSYDSKDQQEG